MPARPARFSPQPTANVYDRNGRLWRSWEIGIGVEEPSGSGARRFGTARTRALLVAVAMLIGVGVGALGQHIVASRNLDVAIVDLAGTIFAKLQSLKGADLP